MILEILAIGFVTLIFTFLGFAVGRISDKIGGSWDVPHHWIYGLLMMVAGLYYYDYPEGFYAFGFGLGHFISDLKDFLYLRFWGPDEPHEWKFWGID